MITHSFGVIPLRRNNCGQWEVLLIQHRHGLHWSFPKGHAEIGEDPIQTAFRELLEETGLSVVSLLTPAIFSENYQFISKGQLVSKTVGYYVALVEGTLRLQFEEVLASKWVLLAEAPASLSFPESQHLCLKVLAIL